MICVVSSVQESPDFTVTVSPPSLNATRGSNQTFHCDYTLPRAAFHVILDWWKEVDGSNILLWSVCGNISNQLSICNFPNLHSGYADRLSGSPSDSFPALQSGHSLTFLSVQVEDAGTYYCEAQYFENVLIGSMKESSRITMNIQGMYSKAQVVGEVRLGDTEREKGERDFK